MRRWFIPSLLACAIIIGSLWLKIAPTSDKGPMRLGISPWPGYELLYLAQVNGYFKEEGLNIDLKQFSSLEDVRNAFENNSIDGMTSTLVELIQAKANVGKKGQVILAADYSNGSDEIIAHPSITNIKQLRGKKIGVESKTLGVVLLMRALELNGLTPKDVDILYLDQVGMAHAFEKREIDAAVSYSPKSTDMKKTGHLIFDSRSIPGEIIDIVSVDQAYLVSHPALVPALQRVWTKALNFTHKQPAKAYAIMAKRESISVDDFGDAMSGLTLISTAEQPEYFAPGGKLDQAVSRTIQVLRQSNDLSKDVGPASQYIYR